MTRRPEQPLTKHTVNLFEGDFQCLRDVHGDVGAGAVIRRLVRHHLGEVNKKVKSGKLPGVEGVEL